METGYVKFFDTREGKLFGFLVDSKGVELFFHYSGGCKVTLDGNMDITFEQTPPRYPKKGDGLMFKRGQNAKGAKATAWCFERDYDDVVEKRKRKLTLDEAKQLLGNATANVLEYTNTVHDWAGISTIETVSVTWSNASSRVAEGKFVRVFSRYKDEDESKNVLQKTTSHVSMYSPDRQKYRETDFEKADAEAMKDLGRERQVRKGVYESVMWNGGSDKFVVDPANIRDVTADELAKTSSYDPWLGDYDWLKCSFAKHYGAENQVVKIIAYLGGHE